MNRINFPHRILLLLGALVFLFAARPPAALGQSASPQIEVEVTPVFEGNYKYGEWLLLWVTLENQGQDTEVVVSSRIENSGGGGVYAAEVSLPAGSRKQIPLYVLPNNFSREIVVSISNSTQEIISKTVEVSPDQNNFYLIGIASPEFGPLSQVTTLEYEDSTRKVVSFNLNIAQLPEKAIALNSLDAIILNDVDTSQLSAEQKQALRDWVQNGGRLIIGGGPGLEKTITGLPEELVSFSPGSVSEMETLPELSAFADNEEILVNGPFLVNQITASSGVELVSQNEQSLVHEWPFGNGQINLIALDLTESPFNAWSGTTHFWQNILSNGTSYPMWMPPDISQRQMRANSMYYPLSSQPSLALPSVRSLGILLIIYILLIGPVNYLILRWRKKLHLAWITIPALTAVFAAGAFGLAYLLRGNDIVINNISIINLQHGGQANYSSYISVFSPSQTTYNFEVSGSPLLSPSSNGGYYDPWSSYGPITTGNTVFLQGSQAEINSLEITQWSLNAFTAEGLSAQLGEIKTDLVLESGKLTGTIENQLPYPIYDAVIVIGLRVEALGTLEPNQPIDVDVDFSEVSPDPGISNVYRLIEKIAQGEDTTLYSPEFERKRSIVESTFQPYGYWLGPPVGASNTLDQDQFELSTTFLLGWLETSPTEITLEGNKITQKATSLLTYNLPLTVDAHNFTLPTSTIPGNMLELSNNAGYCGGSNTYIYLNNGNTIMSFTVPEYFISANVDSLTLEVWDEGVWNSSTASITLSVYDWLNDDWVEYSDLVNGQNIIPDANGLVSNSGEIQFLLERNEISPGGCIYLALGMDGSLNQD